MTKMLPMTKMLAMKKMATFRRSIAATISHMGKRYPPELLRGALGGVAVFHGFRQETVLHK